jgi:two-component system, cell cycle response regulator DivK
MSGIGETLASGRNLAQLLPTIGKHPIVSGRVDSRLYWRDNIDLRQHRGAIMKKILVVEDVEFNRDLIVQLLEDTYEVLTAADGAAGIQLAARERPDLILMDLSLPVIDGWEATRRIKANAALHDIPIIALSAHAMIGDQEKALQSGCDDYLSKPLDEDLLFAKLAGFLGQVCHREPEERRSCIPPGF